MTTLVERHVIFKPYIAANIAQDKLCVYTILGVIRLTCSLSIDDWAQQVFMTACTYFGIAVTSDIRLHTESPQLWAWGPAAE